MKKKAYKIVSEIATIIEARYMPNIAIKRDATKTTVSPIFNQRDFTYFTLNTSVN